MTPFLNLLPMLEAEAEAALATPQRAAHGGVAAARSPTTALPYPLRDGARFTDVAPHMYGGNAVLFQARAVAHPPVSASAADAQLLLEPLPGGAPVLIKYVKGGYGAGAHAAWAAAGLAPALHSCAALPGGITEVVMEELLDADWRCADELSDAQLRACDADARVGRALARAHALSLGRGDGGVRWCHGDCRPANVMLRRGWSPADGDEGVRFVDFDWAGAEGEARYPAFMNIDVPWPHGAAPGALLAQAHDAALWHACRAT